MPPFLFRCPFTRSRTGFIAEEIPGDDPDTYEEVICLACGQVHLVNSKTGRTVGEKDE